MVTQMKCIFDNLTKKQAKTLAEWYSGQGEQDADTWFDTCGIPTPMSDDIKVLHNGDVLVTCKTWNERDELV